MQTQAGVNKDRYKWTNEETRDFLNLICKRNVTAILDSKNLRNAIIYLHHHSDVLIASSSYYSLICRYQLAHKRYYNLWNINNLEVNPILATNFFRKCLLQCCAIQYENEWKHLKMSQIYSIYQCVGIFLFAIQLLDGNTLSSALFA